MTSAATARLIEHCRTIARIFDEELPRTAIAPADHRKGGVNPFYKRTASGLYLEYYYGYPSKIWTPGGYWSMTGSTITYPFTAAEDLVKPFMARLTTRPHEPMQQSRWGCFGPVYAILAVEDDPVESPGAVTPFASDRYEEIKSEWAPLAEGWT